MDKKVGIGLVVIAVLIALSFFIGELPQKAFAAIYPQDPSITYYTRLAANDFINNGVETIGNRQPSLTQATTTVCAIQSPAATSTLSTGAIVLTVSSTTASTVTVAKASTAFATTTLLNSASVSANAQATVLVASTTNSALAQTDATFGPSQWVVFGMSGGVGSFSPTGVCTASFTLLN